MCVCVKEKGEKVRRLRPYSVSEAERRKGRAGWVKAAVEEVVVGRATFGVLSSSKLQAGDSPSSPKTLCCWWLYESGTVLRDRIARLVLINLESSPSSISAPRSSPSSPRKLTRSYASRYLRGKGGG